MKQITSKENSQYKTLLRLARSGRARRKERMLVLEGVHLVQAYLSQFGSQDVELFIKRSSCEHPEVAALAANANATVVSNTLFDHAAPVASPVGVLGLVPMPRLDLPSQQPSFDVLLDGVQDPGNVGAILRTAAATGARSAHLSRFCADPWSPKALRGGMGAQFLLLVEQHQDLHSVAANLNVSLIACVVDSPVSLFKANLEGEVGFIIGSEGSGVSPGLNALAQEKVRIPMRAGIDSLNVAAAAAVCFYEWMRRRERA